MFYLPMPPAPLQLIFFFSFFFIPIFPPPHRPHSSTLHRPPYICISSSSFLLFSSFTTTFLLFSSTTTTTTTSFLLFFTTATTTFLLITRPSPPPPHLTIPLGNSKRSLLKLRVQSLVFLSWVFLSTERAYASFPRLKNLETILFAKALLLHGLYPSSIQDHRSTRSRQKII